jgi:hypothetical protein
MIYLILIILSCISSLLFNKLKINFSILKIFKIQKQSYLTLNSSSITDDEKQKTLLKYSKLLFISSFILFIKFIFIIIPLALIFIYDYFQKTDYNLILIQWKGILISTLSFVVFLLILNKYDIRKIQ